VTLRPRELVERLGPHPATRAGLDPTSDADSLRWLALAVLLGTRAEEQRAIGALRALAGHELASAAGLAAADPDRIAAVLAREGVPRPEATAAVLLRACRAFVERWQGCVSRLAADADDLSGLGSRVAGLASGLGVATAARFLRPLRERIPAARELPLPAAARAAALHLGWLAPGDDEEGEPAVLRTWLARTPDAPPFFELEAALERLGQTACLRGRARRCPLGEACPLH
jgi:endonuclease III